MDRHPRGPPAAGRDREAALDGVDHRGAAHRAGRRRARGAATRSAARGPACRRPEPAHRRRSCSSVPTGVGKTELAKSAGRLPVRRRARHGPHRHERVLRAARGRAPHRCPARLRRLRGGRPAHRGGAPPALLGRAARRGREGAPRDLRHPAAGARRRPAHRRPGPHRRLPQRHPRDDQQPRQPVPHRPQPRRRGQARGGDGRGAGRLQAGVPQPARRGRDLRRAHHAPSSPTSSSCRSASWPPGWSTAGSPSR